ncbi:ANTAR domain-containing response regulator [Jiella sonneratiae]|uniref:ANTAR domain-containing protein n=1 Tax=Jiella sonneratiae TaxID=2816856 RepID=A0ABS3J543_9HYPH|nr:ANTAR domain-containing protein [Jiella sonneratiae]MBO0904794.1 ANTAR domain-containing protein [Jiella sonneratiae]
MVPGRFVQNFSHRRAILVSNDDRAIATLTATLGRLGLTVSHRPTKDEAADLSQEPLQAAEVVLFVDGDLARAPVLPLSDGSGPMPRVPVVGLVGVEAPSRLRALMQTGATAFLAKPVYAGSVFSALYLAVNEHAAKADQLAAIGAHETRRRQRRFVIKAVLKLMRERGLDDDDAAFAILRRESMQARLSIEAYCQFVVQRSAALSESGADGPLMSRSAE